MQRGYAGQRSIGDAGGTNDTSASLGAQKTGPTGVEAERNVMAIFDAKRRRLHSLLLSACAASCVALVGQAAQAQVSDDADASRSPNLQDQLRQRLGETDAVEQRATLEADRIDYDPNTEVVRASGDVRVFFADRVLRADEVIYDGVRDEISAAGNVRLINPDGSVVAADAGAFDSALENGLIEGARAVLSDGKARIAAVEGRRVDGRYTTLSKAVFSPCDVCEDNPTPLWRIRARRIIQDNVARDIIYEDARFEVLGVPVGFLPFFRHADPSVKRRSGFLTPEYIGSSELGQGVKTPYFLAFGPSRDITITPYLLTEDFPVLELEYRDWQTFGKYTLGGSATWSEDDVESGFRGHVIGDGLFDIGSGFELGYDVLFASDDTYLRRYSISNIDRTTSNVFVQRFTDSGFARIEGSYFQSYREEDFAGEIPLVAPQFTAEEVFEAPEFLGGDFALSASGVSLRRTNGRDVARLSGGARWDRVFTTSAGVVFDAGASVRGDVYYVQDDPTLDEGVTGRFLPLASLAASYPLGLATDTADHVISPIATVAIAPYGGNPEDIPNEDSVAVELDEISIFERERVTGFDRWEEGPRATVGLRYQRIARDDGFDLDASVGQSYRLDDTNVFSERSGLSGATSDYVGSWRVGYSDDLVVGQRLRVSERGEIGRNEVTVKANVYDRLRLSGDYVFLNADPEEGETDDRAEIRGDAELDITQYWSVLGNARRNIEDERFVNAGGGLRYRDECVEVNFSVDRRFNDVDGAPSSTNFGLSVKLISIDAE